MKRRAAPSPSSGSGFLRLRKVPSARVSVAQAGHCLRRAVPCGSVPCAGGLVVGHQRTRLYSRLYGTKLNVGRVMTPTLAMVVQREKRLRRFRSSGFYTVQLSCGFPAQSGRIKTREEAERDSSLLPLQKAAVKQIERRQKKEKPPKLYDLTALQRDANRIYGYTAQQTLDYAQTLYEKKLATYPRTDSRF